MNVNWTVRLKNKVWLTSFFAAILTFIYTILGLFDIFPEVTRNEAGEIINSFLMLLSLFGVVIDPTTAGLNDSIRAMGYTEPHKEEIPVEEEVKPEAPAEDGFVEEDLVSKPQGEDDPEEEE